MLKYDSNNYVVPICHNIDNMIKIIKNIKGDK